MKLNDAYGVFDRIEQELNNLKDKNGWLPVEFDHDYNDDDERYKHYQALRIIDKLEDVKAILDWTSKPIVAEGYPTKSVNGRYNLNGFDLVTGDVVDALDEIDGWFQTTIKHRDDYYVEHLEDRAIESIKIRIR